MDPIAARRDLLERLELHQARLEGYLTNARPRNARLAGVAITGSAVSAVLTAGPAIGGPSFTSATASLLAVTDTSHIWRVLCFGALLLSVLAAVAVNLSNNLAIGSRVLAAETASSEIEGLHTLLTFDEISVGDAARGLHSSTAKVAFLPRNQPAASSAKLRAARTERPAR